MIYIMIYNDIYICTQVHIYHPEPFTWPLIISHLVIAAFPSKENLHLVQRFPSHVEIFQVSSSKSHLVGALEHEWMMNFHSLGNFIIPTDELIFGGLEHEFYFPQELGWWSNLTTIFQRGRYTTN